MDLEGQIVELEDIVLKQSSLIELLLNKITLLESKLKKATSRNSSLPPSKDENRPKKNQSLRRISGK